MINVNKDEFPHWPFNWPKGFSSEEVRGVLLEELTRIAIHLSIERSGGIAQKEELVKFDFGNGISEINLEERTEQYASGYRAHQASALNAILERVAILYGEEVMWEVHRELHTPEYYLKEDNDEISSKQSKSSN